MHCRLRWWQPVTLALVTRFVRAWHKMFRTCPITPPKVCRGNLMYALVLPNSQGKFKILSQYVYTNPIPKHVGVIRFVFLFSIFYWSNPRSQICVAWGNLRWNVNQMWIENWIFLYLIVVIGSAFSWFLDLIYRSLQICWILSVE